MGATVSDSADGVTRYTHDASGRLTGEDGPVGANTYQHDVADSNSISSMHGNNMWRLGIIAALGLIAWVTSDDKKIFVTYDYDNDRNYKHLLVAWAKNAAFDLAFNDYSVDISVDSNDLGVIRRVVSARIKESSCVLCVVGEHTWKSKWVEWELQKARELGKPLVAVKTAKSNRAPAELVNAGASWALAFKFDSIKKAIEKAG